ncbi:MAG: hypothetical protein Q8N90_04410 [bacterium]|nr:hypothetical protein [bacterium]
MVEVNKNLSEQGGDQDDLESGGAAELAKKSPIGWWEVFLILPFLIVADIVDLFSWSGIGTVISWILDMVAMAIPTIWLIFKGRRAEWMLIASLIEFIPVVDFLPIRTVTFLILYFKDKVPTEKMGKLGEAIEKTEAVAEQAAGKIKK